jgi:hypothetical protein
VSCQHLLLHASFLSLIITINLLRGLYRVFIVLNNKFKRLSAPNRPGSKFVFFGYEWNRPILIRLYSSSSKNYVRVLQTKQFVTFIGPLVVALIPIHRIRVFVCFIRSGFALHMGLQRVYSFVGSSYLRSRMAVNSSNKFVFIFTRISDEYEHRNISQYSANTNTNFEILFCLRRIRIRVESMITFAILKCSWLQA